MATNNKFYLKKGNTANPLVTTLSDAIGPVDLTGLTVHFKMRPKDSKRRTKVDAAATVDSDQVTHKGRVSYSWVDADVDTAGEFLGEFEVTTLSGKPTTFPNGERYIEITIGAGVDDLPTP